LGYGGYLKWFVDGQLVTAVYGDDLQQTSQTEIPSEPMYMVMNLAVSKDWGFPDAYFLNCPKKCWSCLDPACRSCALPSGFCENLPASFEIESVRVYQPRDRKEHGGYSLGCSPPNRPTKEYIEAHMDLYKLRKDDGPLNLVQKGGGECPTMDDHQCGTTKRGICAPNATCICNPDWTGPHCLAHEAYLEDSELTNPPTKNHSVLGWTIGLILGLLLVISVPLKPFFRPRLDETYIALPSVHPDDNLVKAKVSNMQGEAYQNGPDGLL
jgi:hypothetical protein